MFFSLAFSAVNERLVSFKVKYSLKPLYCLLMPPVTSLAAEEKNDWWVLLALLNITIAITCNSKKLRKVKYRRMKRKMFFTGKASSFKLLAMSYK